MMTLDNHTKVDGNFLDILFPENILYGSLGGPLFFTDIHSSYGGHEQRNTNWAEPRIQYEINSTLGESEGLLSFFRMTKGRAKGFLLKDWSDYTAHDQVLTRCPGNSRIYHLTKTYTIGNHATQRRIFKAKDVAIEVYVEGISQRLDHAINYNAGLIEFATAPPQNATVKANFQFYVPVRFDNDGLSLSTDGYKNHSCNNLKMIELRFWDTCRT